VVNRGYPAARVKGSRETEPSYELGSAVTGVEQRKVGRWIGSNPGRRRIDYCRKARNPRVMSSRIRVHERKTESDRCRSALVTERLRRASTSDFFHRGASPTCTSTHKMTTNWRAGCGRSACPVRREGEAVRLLPTPIPGRIPRYPGAASAQPCTPTVSIPASFEGTPTFRLAISSHPLSNGQTRLRLG